MLPEPTKHHAWRIGDIEIVMLGGCRNLQCKRNRHEWALDPADDYRLHSSGLWPKCRDVSDHCSSWQPWLLTPDSFQLGRLFWKCWFILRHIPDDRSNLQPVYQYCDARSIGCFQPLLFWFGEHVPGYNHCHRNGGAFTPRLRYG